MSKIQGRRGKKQMIAVKKIDTIEALNEILFEQPYDTKIGRNRSLTVLYSNPCCKHKSALLLMHLPVHPR